MTNTIVQQSGGIFAFPWWQWIVIIVAITGCLCFIAWFLVKIVRGRIKIGSVEIERDALSTTKAPSIDSQSVQPFDLKCATCPEKGELALVVKTLLDLTIQEHDLMVRGILASQMMKVEEKLLYMKHDCLLRFRQLLSEKLKATDCQLPPIQHKDYLYYKLILQEFMLRMKDLIRSACLNNGFSKMSHEDYSKYIEHQYIKVKSDAITFFDENYIDASVITPDDLKNTDVLMMGLKDRIADIFNEMRKKSETADKQINMIHQQRRTIIDHAIGMDVMMGDTNGKL